MGSRSSCITATLRKRYARYAIARAIKSKWSSLYLRAIACSPQTPISTISSRIFWSDDITKTPRQRALTFLLLCVKSYRKTTVFPNFIRFCLLSSFSRSTVHLYAYGVVREPSAYAVKSLLVNYPTSVFLAAHAFENSALPH